MDKELLKRFKNLTGFKFTDVSRMFGVSRQFIDQLIHNHSLTYRSSLAFYLTEMIDVKIMELSKIQDELKMLKCEIRLSIRNEEKEGSNDGM